MKKSNILHLTIRELMDDLSSILVGFIISTVVVLVFIVMYLEQKLPYIFLRGILFLYALAIFIMGLRLHAVHRIKKTGKKLGFKLITPIYLQPRLEGTYQRNWWQIHYRSKETGGNPGLLRTYIKLQFKARKNFSKEKLGKYRNYDFNGQKIIVVKHLVRPHKSYLLLKRTGFTFNKKDIIDLMDLLLKIAKQAEIK